MYNYNESFICFFEYIFKNSVFLCHFNAIFLHTNIYSIDI